MFIRSFAALVLVLPALASALSVLQNLNDVGANGVLPTTGNQGSTINQCNTGTLQCCNQVQSADSSDLSTFLGLIGIDVGGLDALVGLSCSPISFLAIGEGGSCSAQPVCCTNNHFDGIVAVGCQPVNIVARGLEELAEPMVAGILVPIGSFDTAAPANVEGLPADFADLPANFADLPATFADFPAAIANLFTGSFGLPVGTAADLPANSLSDS